MKVKFGKFKTYVGPYQLAEYICFWTRNLDKKPPYEKPDYVYNLGNFLAYGYWKKPEREVGEVYDLFDNEREPTWLYRFLMWINSKKPDRTIKVRVDLWDLWSLDHTLGLIILPALKEFRKEWIGMPTIDIEDLPEDLHDAKGEEQYEYILDEMIFAFERVVDPYWEHEFYPKGEDKGTLKGKQLDNGNVEIIIEGADRYDLQGINRTQERINNGLRLFGKYYQSLWL